MRLLDPARAVVALALPPRCPGCGAVVAADHRFCATCWSSLRFLTPPWCATCQLPFEAPPASGAQCGRCLDRTPRHAGVFAAVAYSEVARGVALRLKYGGRTGFAETAARHMRRHLPADAQLLVPVPLHRWRLWSRGFNQAALIAAALGRLSGVAHDPLLLRRTRATPVLRGLGARRRAQAVRGAFEVAAGAGLRGASVVLIDDVYTSGATAEACVAALRRAGAAKVAILCWARVLVDGHD